MSDTVEARLDRLEASAKVDAAILRDHIARLLALESAPKPPTPGSPCDDCTAGDAVKVLEEERRHRQDAARGWEAALARAEKAEAALSDSRIEREELSRALAVQEQENNHLRAEAAHAQKRVAALERDLSNTAGSYHEVKAALSEAQRAGDAIVVKLREKCEELERERDEAREAWRLWCATCLPAMPAGREGRTMATQHDSPLYRAVYAAALVDSLRAFADVLNTTPCGAADRGDLFASAHEAARTLAEKAVAQDVADRGAVDHIRYAAARFLQSPPSAPATPPLGLTGIDPAGTTGCHTFPVASPESAGDAEDQMERNPDGTPFYRHGPKCEGACDYSCEGGAFATPGPADAKPGLARDPCDHFTAGEGERCRCGWLQNEHRPESPPGDLCAREGCGHRRDEHITANRRGVGAECLAEVIGEVDDLCACMEFVEPSVSAKGCAR